MWPCLTRIQKLNVGQKWAPTGALLLRSNARIDLLVADIGLPGGINGRQMADTGRTTRPDLPVLFMTGYAQPHAMENAHAQSEPYKSVLTKPFVLDALALKVKALLKNNHR